MRLLSPPYTRLFLPLVNRLAVRLIIRLIIPLVISLTIMIMIISMSLSLAADNLPLSMPDAIKEARQGNPDAMLIVARQLLISTDPLLHEDAFGWALYAARLGHPEAAELSGYLYRTGRGVSKNDVKARYWLKKALKSGADGAALELALLYADERFTGRNRDKAEAYFQIALNQRDPHACLLVVQSKYRHGIKPSFFIPELTCAANGGQPVAMRMLADFIDNNPSPHAQSEARKWRQNADKLDHKGISP